MKNLAEDAECARDFQDAVKDYGSLFEAEDKDVSKDVSALTNITLVSCGYLVSLLLECTRPRPRSGMANISTTLCRNRK